MKKAGLLMALILGSYVVNAQTSLGVRGGASSIGDGLSLKHFTSGTTAIEGLLTIGDNHFAVAAIFEMHKPITGVDAPGLFLEYGLGPYVGLYDNGPNNDDDIRIGATGIVGLEYRFPKAPFTVGLDYNPNIQIVNDFDIDVVDFSAAIRYIF